MTNNSKTLYTGVTNDVRRRVYEHKHGNAQGFTSKYKTDRLVYYEVARDAQTAITREKQIKGMRRSKKIALIESVNPFWQDMDIG